jgi:hypothetical protein
MSQEDLKIITETITGILNPDNELRKVSIKKLDELRKNPLLLISSLFEIIKRKIFI